MMYWAEKNKLSPEEKILIQQFFTQRFWVNKLTATFIVVCDPEVAMQREERIALSSKLGETTNPETIRKLVARYKRAYEELSPAHPQIHLLDTTNLGEMEMVEIIAQKTLDAMEAKTRS